MNCSFLHCLLSKSALISPGTPLTSASVHDTTSAIASAGTKVILPKLKFFLYECFFSEYHIFLHCSSKAEETETSGTFPIAHI